jgi:hypothetical protein
MKTKGQKVVTCTAVLLLTLSGCTTTSNYHGLLAIEQKSRQKYYGGSFPLNGPSWFYTGSDSKWHYFVHEVPSFVGAPKERKYRIPVKDLSIANPIPHTEDRSQWRNATGFFDLKPVHHRAQ